MAISRLQGFTLAELLIALTILAEIATFSIPKILYATTTSQSNAAAREAVGMLSSAYTGYTNDNGYNSAMTAGALSPYMNYVKVDSTGVYDDAGAYNASYACSSGNTCLRLHNGGVLFYQTGMSFGGTATTNAIQYFFDPDGVRDGTATNNLSKSVLFILFFNGRVSSWGKVATFTSSSGTNAGGTANNEPVWFSW